ncbi:MAG: CAP domain-containing protein [Burkholderiaceae bacterium]|nr:CAP domain-containing protein [Burkholderiaceae bacterium]
MKRLLVLSLLSCSIVMPMSVKAEGCPQNVNTLEALRMLNAFRAQARRCGTQWFEAAGPVHWSGQLQTSAQRYAIELAQRDTLSHEGLQNHSLRDRLRQSGYPMRMGGENLSAGLATLPEVLSQWSGSPAHCDNLMDKRYEEVGLACVAGPGQYGYYWVLHLGVPLVMVPGLEMASGLNSAVALRH